jgi:hypothetical protein
MEAGYDDVNRFNPDEREYQAAYAVNRNISQEDC